LGVGEIKLSFIPIPYPLIPIPHPLIPIPYLLTDNANQSDNFQSQD